MIALVVGVLLALAIGLLATSVGLDRDRGFYPFVMIVIASYYALFAIMGASTHILVLELIFCAFFLVGAVLGFRSSLWVVVAALAAHGVFDLIPRHCHIQSRRAKLVAGVLSYLRYYCSGLPGMVTQDGGASGAYSLTIYSKEPLQIGSAFSNSSPRRIVITCVEK